MYDLYKDVRTMVLSSELKSTKRILAYVAVESVADLGEEGFPESCSELPSKPVENKKHKNTTEPLWTRYH